VPAKPLAIRREGYILRRSISSAAAAALVALLTPASASALVPHTVQPGETLWSIAAATNFTTRALAAANGISETSQVVVGQTVQIPSQAQAAGALQGSAPAATSATPAPMGGGYTVRAGETLSLIAARSGISVSRLAAMNGLDPTQLLVAGRSLRLPGGAPAPAAASSVSGTEPQTTNERVSPQTVSQIALDHGVSPSLANAIAQQESGHNNALVSSANARGVMQIIPSTWDYVERLIAGRQINPASAYENVHAGVMYLGRLLQDTGNIFTATASYYQGERSVRRIGMLPETRRYVNRVMSVRGLYGGPRP
jgi:LysM repeat protein